MAKRLITMLLALALAGCGGFAQMGRARTLDPGQWEFGASAALVGPEDESYEPADFVPADTVVGAGGLSPELHLAVGVASRVELGVRAYALGGELTVKTQLFRSEPFDLSLAPAVFAGFLQRPGEDRGAVYARVPLLAGVNLGRRTSIVLAPEAAWALDLGGDRWPELWGGTAAVHRRWPDGTQLGLGVTWLRFRRRVPFSSDSGGLVGADIFALTFRGGAVRGGVD